MSECANCGYPRKIAGFMGYCNNPRCPEYSPASPPTTPNKAPEIDLAQKMMDDLCRAQTKCRLSPTIENAENLERVKRVMLAALRLHEAPTPIIEDGAA